MQWTYDLRGLDARAWLCRAAAEVAAQRAAGGSVTLLLGEARAAEIAALREALEALGEAPEARTIAGVSALVLSPAGDSVP